MSRGQNPGQVEQQQQQATGSTTGAKLSRIELNVLQTMVAVIVCYLICYSVIDIANFLQPFGVSQFHLVYPCLLPNSIPFSVSAE